MKFRYSLSYGLGALCLSTCLALAQDGAPKDGEPKGPPPPPPAEAGKGQGGGRVSEFIKRIDSNNDGKISKEEFEEFSKRDTGDRFSKLDANSDGFVDQEEMSKVGERMRDAGASRGGRGEGGGFRRPDGDRDGRPQGGPRDGQRPEGGPRDGDRPDGGPRDGRPEGGPRDGRPDGDRPQGGPPGMNPDEIFSRIDKNGDGSSDLEEYLEFSKQEVEQRFKRMDQDGDGKVTKEEFRKGMDRLRSMMRGMGGPGGPGGQRDGGFRRPGGDGDGPREGGFRRPPEGEGGFRRPPQQDGDRPGPRPEGEKAPEAPKKDPA